MQQHKTKTSTSRLQDVVEALDILNEYISDDDLSVFAEGFTINVRVTKEVPDERRVKLEDLGFFYDDEIACFYSFLDGI